jgi:hypothetical protein
VGEYTIARRVPCGVEVLLESLVALACEGLQRDERLRDDQQLCKVSWYSTSPPYSPIRV